MIRLGRAWAPLSGLVLVAAIAACGGDASFPNQPGVPGDSIRLNEIAVTDDTFNPFVTAVSPGDTVTWTWLGSNEHNVTWNFGELPNSETQVAGSHQVPMPMVIGIYTYHCSIHGTEDTGMRGRIFVQ